MSGQSHRGRDYKTGEPIEVKVVDGVVVGIEACPDCPGDRWLAPGLVDVQVNGYHGVDFQCDGLDENDLLRAMAGLARDGCHRWMLTLISAEWPVLLDRLSCLRKLRESSPELQRAIVGWHVEGPFLSDQPGYRGAHDPRVMSDPDPAAVDALRAVTGSDRVMLTLAPERSGSDAVIRRAVELGMTVSLGHTNASAGYLHMAEEAGASGFTHLGNGMPQAMDRHDNIVCRVLDTDCLTVGLIPDGIHVSPQLFRLIHRALPAGRIYYTSDAMAAGGAPPGRYTIGKIEVEVGADEVVRMPGATNFAGSALRPIEGVRRAARMLGVSWREVWDAFSVRPAALVALASGLEVGAPGDVVSVSDECVLL
ncbi:MAG: N-acetylglucosamine-6-phosphate deacetylase [Verrucomicrobiae bacterium]|nr:N-acetylglucosamine-6-phosphate deacetylase [Verrucomicrobiae bacterium]